MEAKELRIGNYVYSNKFVIKSYGVDGFINILKNIDNFTPIPLTEEWLLKFGFENWGLGTLYNNEYECYVRYVLHNDLDGTSNFEVHYIKSTYGGEEHLQYVISCDEDDRLNWGTDLENVHQLQNLYFALTNEELIIK